MAEIAALGAFILIWLLFWLPLALTVARLAQVTWAYPIAQEHKIPLLLPLYGVAPIAVWGYNQLGAAKSWAEYGLVWGRHLGFSLGGGFVVGVLGVGLLIAVEMVLGWRSLRLSELKLSQLGRLSAIAIGLGGLTVFIAGVEELVFRGVFVQGLLVATPVWGMVLLASAIFAVSHLVWDGLAGVPTLPGLALMGGILILARWVDGGLLGLPWGLHAGWIFAIALIDTFNLAAPVQTAPRWLAGNADQPLTGLPALGLLVLTGLGLWGYHHMLL